MRFTKKVHCNPPELTRWCARYLSPFPQYGGWLFTDSRPDEQPRATRCGEPHAAPGGFQNPDADPWPATEARAVSLHRSQQIVRGRLHGGLAQLFWQITRAHLHVVWAPPPPLPWPTRELLHACEVRHVHRPHCRGATEACQICLARQLRAMATPHPHSRPTLCGDTRVLTSWLPVRVENLLIAGLGFQSMVAPPEAASSPAPSPPHPTVPQPPSFSPGEQSRATRLLRLLVHDLEETCLADLESERCRQLASHLETRQATGRAETAASAAGPPAIPLHLPPVLTDLLRAVQQDFAHPLTLKALALQLHMNAAYLSDLFSREVGIGFKDYLTRLRVQRASELLRDADRNIADVAFAVGYTDPHRFSRAFRERTGLSPRSFRRGCPHRRSRPA